MLSVSTGDPIGGMRVKWRFYAVLAFGTDGFGGSNIDVCGKLDNDDGAIVRATVDAQHILTDVFQRL